MCYKYLITPAWLANVMAPRLPAAELPCIFATKKKGTPKAAQCTHFYSIHVIVINQN